MTRVIAEFVNADELVAYFDTVLAKLNKVGKEMSEEIGNSIRLSARRHVPVWSGFLRESIKVTTVKPGEVVVSVGAPYGAFVEYGYAPHRVSTGTPTWGYPGDLIQTWLDSKRYVAGWRSTIHVKKWSQGAHYMETAMENFDKRAGAFLTQKLNQILGG